MGANGTADLGNFLSGMETGDAHDLPGGGRTLGNFLSGMETLVRDGKLLRNIPALETSLVEWKLSIWSSNSFRFASLETSLVEWKPA